MLPKEAKYQSLQVMKHALATYGEYSKETIEGMRLKAVGNISNTKNKLGSGDIGK